MQITSTEFETEHGVIPANAQVLMMLGAAQHDERRFHQPEKFDIQRNDLNFEKAFTASANHLAFGAGRHFCVGSMLAKAEIDIAFNQLFDRTKGIRLASNALVETGLFTRGFLNLPIEWVLN